MIARLRFVLLVTLLAACSAPPPAPPGTPAPDVIVVQTARPVTPVVTPAPSASPTPASVFPRQIEAFSLAPADAEAALQQSLAALHGPGGARGEHWIDDANGDGLSELVVQVPLGGGSSLSFGHRGIKIYQWDGRRYTATLPVTFGSCAYHALAEAQRIQDLGDWRSLVPWLHEFRRRVRAEMRAPGGACTEHFQGDKAWSVWDTSRSYVLEVMALEQLLGPDYDPVDTCYIYATMWPDHASGLVEAPQRMAVGGLGWGRRLRYVQLNLVQCAATPPRVAGRLQWPDPGEFEDDPWLPGCTAALNGEPAVGFIPGDGGTHNLLRQITTWTCSSIDEPRRWITDVTCQWNDGEYVKFGSRFVWSAGPALTAEQQARLLQAVDCAGEP